MLIRRASTGEIGKLLGAKWKELDDEEKKVCAPRHSGAGTQQLTDVCASQPYLDQALADKARAEQEKSEYDVSHQRSRDPGGCVLITFRRARRPTAAAVTATTTTSKVDTPARVYALLSVGSPYFYPVCMAARYSASLSLPPSRFFDTSVSL